MDEVNAETGAVERIARLSRPDGVKKFTIGDDLELYQILKQDFNIEVPSLKNWFRRDFLFFGGGPQIFQKKRQKSLTKPKRVLY